MNLGIISLSFIIYYILGNKTRIDECEEKVNNLDHRVDNIETKNG